MSCKEDGTLLKAAYDTGVLVMVGDMLSSKQTDKENGNAQKATITGHVTLNAGKQNRQA
jgi:hypothetical protein